MQYFNNFYKSLFYFLNYRVNFCNLSVMKKILIIAVAVCLNYSCGQNEWNAENRKLFVDSCNLDGQMKDYCECYLNQLIKEEISPIESGTLSEDKVMEVAEKCFDKLY